MQMRRFNRGSLPKSQFDLHVRLLAWAPPASYCGKIRRGYPQHTELLLHVRRPPLADVPRAGPPIGRGSWR